MDPKSNKWNSKDVENGTPVNLFVDRTGHVFATLDTGQIQMSDNCAALQPVAKPGGIAVDLRGNIYVSDSEKDQILQIDLECKMHSLGSEGNGAKQFHNPSGVAVDEQGHIYVADSANHRVVRMDDFTGNGWTTFGRYGENAGEFILPTTVRLDAQDRIYIGDSGNGRIVRIDEISGSSWTVLRLRRRPGQFSAPVDVAADARGRVFVADKEDAQLVRTNDMKGTQWVEWLKKGEVILEQPESIFAQQDGSSFSTDSKKSQVVALSSDFQTARSISTLNFFIQPYGVFINDNGSIFLTDIQDDAIACLHSGDPKNKEIFWGENGHNFKQPTGICLDNKDRIYVADQANRRIVRMDNLQGKNWTTLTFPDSGNHSATPIDVSMDRRGVLFILDEEHQRIIRLSDFSRKHWREFGTPGYGINQFYRPSGMFLDPQNRIYIADTGNRRVVRIDDISGKGWIALGEKPAQQIRFLPAD
jgi:streptogramin lyase